jgi:futalosine hydrolase
MTRLLIVTAVGLERERVAAGGNLTQSVEIGPYAGLRGDTPAGEVVVVSGGVGPAAAAAVAATATALERYDVLVSAGVAGAFPSARLTNGDVVLATSIVAADLGAMSPERFLDLAALGLDGAAAVACDPATVSALRDRVLAADLHVAVGPVLTLSTMTGTADRAAELMAEHGAVAEAMEGAGVAHVATVHALPVVELRTISNEVGDRNRDGWDLRGALSSLERATAAVLSGEWP